MANNDSEYSDFFLVGQDNNQILILTGFISALILGLIVLALYQQMLHSKILYSTRISECEHSLNAGKEDKHAKPRHEDDSEEVIRFSELDDNRFQSGSAEINQTFAQGIHAKVIPRVVQLAQKYGEGRVIVEVYGFTDGVPVRNTASCTMDKTLVVFNQGGEAPSPCSNVELGKLRADTVAKQIRSDLMERSLGGVRVLGYSAGQTVLSNGELATSADDGKDDPGRRFVEVRFNITQ